VAYDGSHFHGFAVNPGVRTVAGDISQALSRIVGVPVEITGAGRTDAGVHAWGQVVSVDLPETIDLDNLPRRLTKMCAPGVVIRSAEWAESDFDARFSALWRHYRYLVLNDPVADPLLEHTSWWVPTHLDLSLMRLACDPLIGEHDFSSFCRRPPDVVTENGDIRSPSMVRRVIQAHWTEERSHKGQRLLWFDIRATAFCHQMVRSIVGTLVDVGSGRITAGSLREVLVARDRRRAGQVAPPQGLTLWEVGYAGHHPGRRAD
jgi:tRNA pseudouridine38-40 synthase